MTILQELILAITQAIRDYQAEKQAADEVVPDERQQDIIEINQLLEASQEEEGAYRLRKNLADYIAQKSWSWLGAYISLALDRSRLRHFLMAVLEQFSENDILARQNSELYQRQTLIGTAQNGEDLLVKLEIQSEENEKYHKQVTFLQTIVEQYRLACADVGTQLQATVDQNRLLRQEIEDLQINLTEQLNILKSKIRERELLIEELKKINEQLSSEKDEAYTKAIKIQRELDEVLPKYKDSLETISKLRSLLKKHGIKDEVELNDLFDLDKDIQPEKKTVCELRV